MRRWFLIAGLVILLGVASVASSQATGNSRVGLVVQFGDGSVATRCVEFAESSISGHELLARSGFNTLFEYSGLGASVCKIQNDGCDFPSETCFCECMGAPCVYWAYHHLVGGSWQYSGFGASSYQVHDGDVEGWAWGAGSPTDGVQPPVFTFEQICAPPATATPQPSPTPPPPTPTVTQPAIPTSTPEPVVWFRLDQNPIEAGRCTMLRWDTSGLKELELDGGIIEPNGAREVCPAVPQGYTLSVVTAGGDEQVYRLELGVVGTVPATPASQTPASESIIRASVTPTPIESLASSQVIATPGLEHTLTPDGVIVAETVTVAPILPSITDVPTRQPQVVVLAAPTLLVPTETPPIQATRDTIELRPLDSQPPTTDEDASSGVAPEYLWFGGLATMLTAVLIVVRLRQVR